MKIIKTLIAGSILMLISFSSANAALTGSFSYSALPDQADWSIISDGDPSTADILDFANNIFQVDQVSGDFASIFSTGDTGTIADITLDETTPYSGLNPLMSIAPDFSFQLDSLNIVLLTENAVYLTGTGTFFAEGFGQAAGKWQILANSLGETSFSGAAIPEPGTLALFGISLLGLTLTRRRRKY